MRHFIFFCFLPLFLLSYTSPEQVDQELKSAESLYQKAKNMFNPWYTGPLVTPSASMMPPGYANIQPYLFITGVYGTYNTHRHAVSLPDNLYTLKVISPMQIGITDTMDAVITPSAESNWQDGEHGGGIGDVSITIGFPIVRQTLYVPGMKFTVAETFPSGKYKKLSHNGLGLNATGGGSYQTQFGFTIAKLIWWTYPYPMNLRFFVGYNVPTPVHVKNFNTYGGGFGTRGKVRPGNTLTTDLGMELSFSERWVFAMDIVYVAQNRTAFHGTAGTTASGAPAVVGTGYSDNLSLAPAIEYNWNENLGILWGFQFSVYGRNSQNFTNGQFSVVYTW